MNKYPKYLKDCAYCGLPIIAKNAGFDKPTRKYCSKKCARIVSNKNRVWKESSKNKISIRNTRTGCSRDKLYKVFLEMHSRCEREDSMGYSNYGGRGIKVSQEWQDYFSFREWAEKQGYDKNQITKDWGDKQTIERKDVNGDYSPDNCCIIAMRLQSKNRRPYSEWKRKLNGTKPMSLDENIKEARKLYDKRGKQPWAVFNSGAYKKYL